MLNDPDDEMRSYARTLAADGAGGTRILHDGDDVGVVSGWNLALRDARAEHVCIVHEDAELHAGCAARLLQTLRERPDAGAVAPRVLLPDGSAKDGAIIWADGAGSRMDASATAEARPVDYAGSSCLMLRREAALGVSGLDERFFPAIYVDASLSVALWQAGWTCLCDSRAVHLHRTAAMVDEARGPRRSTRFREFLGERNRARFREVFADFLAEQAPRAAAHDARLATPAEILDAAARASAREQRVLAAPRAPLADRLELPSDIEAHAAGLRREIEDEFMAELIAREAALAGEAAAVHRAYAELHADRDRVHAEYAALHAELERVHAAHDEAHAELERVHAAHARQTAELERVHRAYAELWQDRERLLARPPALEAEDHA